MAADNHTAIAITDNHNFAAANYTVVAKTDNHNVAAANYTVVATTDKHTAATVNYTALATIVDSNLVVKSFLAQKQDIPLRYWGQEHILLSNKNLLCFDCFTSICLILVK